MPATLFTHTRRHTWLLGEVYARGRLTEVWHHATESARLEVRQLSEWAVPTLHHEDLPDEGRAMPTFGYVQFPADEPFVLLLHWEEDDNVRVTLRLPRLEVEVSDLARPT